MINVADKSCGLQAVTRFPEKHKKREENDNRVNNKRKKNLKCDVSDKISALLQESLLVKAKKHCSRNCISKQS